jgi:hypothetical protein
MRGPDYCSLCWAVPEPGEEFEWQFGRDLDGVPIAVCFDCAADHPDLLVGVSAADLLRLQGADPGVEWDIALAKLPPAT